MTRENYVTLVKRIGEQITERAEEIVGSLNDKQEITITAKIDAISVPTITWQNTIYGRIEKVDVIRD